MKTLNKDTMPLDSRVKHENDTMDTMPNGFQIKSGMTRESITQSGRSMVEMLGVLAVVGVLSIGGIMGYSYGMDKYRANETINQIMLRAIDLMTQAGNGNETLSLSAWENEQTQYTFGEPVYTTDDLIKLDVGTASNPIPKHVCEMIFDGMKSQALYIDINGIEVDVDAECSDNNIMTFYFEGGGAQIDVCNPACGENEYCDNGICFKGGMPEGTKHFGKECSTDADCGPCEWCALYDEGYVCAPFANGTCIVDGQLGLCRSGECYPKGDGCTTNDDCTEVGTYCASTNRSDEVRFQSGETGSCVPLDFIRKEFGGETYYISNKYLSWWDAEYACDAIGKTVGKNIKMVEVTDLVEVSTWNGEHDHDITLTAFGQELKAQVGSEYIWTRNLRKDDGDALYVATDGNIGTDYRHAQSNFFLAVCR
ncbi:MAG: hypothetical protein IKY98_00100 [Alphaproteobacteria bacterium]|nr:hypothetical protein [Alphaproteobacteria bacterium]